MSKAKNRRHQRHAVPDWMCLSYRCRGANRGNEIAARLIAALEEFSLRLSVADDLRRELIEAIAGGDPTKLRGGELPEITEGAALAIQAAADELRQGLDKCHMPAVRIGGHAFNLLSELREPARRAAQEGGDS